MDTEIRMSDNVISQYASFKYFSTIFKVNKHGTWLAQVVKHATRDLSPVVGSSPMWGEEITYK